MKHTFDNSNEPHNSARIHARAAIYRARDPLFARWAAGSGVIKHSELTQVRCYEMADFLHESGAVTHRDHVYNTLIAADRLANAGMWLVVHMTYAQRVYLDGRAMTPEDFKSKPEGHTGGALNMVPAYAGYLAVDAIMNMTRGWMMGQGHCVAGIDAMNLLVDNMNPVHAARYALDDAALSRFVSDFYSYKITSDGRPESPLGSHVNVHTAGGLLEGGYLGFAELQYVHRPLPGQRLVVFLSDGAFEEQRGSDWAPRWWRGEDSGLVAPIMICNGRRIDQRTTMAQSGGVHWFHDHLQINGFDPIEIDGTDPAAFAWAVFEMEQRLAARAQMIHEGAAHYPVRLPYAIAQAPKGFGFPGAGTNNAHNLPLLGNPHNDATALREFNAGARRLWQPLEELLAARQVLRFGVGTARVAERDNEIATKEVSLPHMPATAWKKVGDKTAPMAALDERFCDIALANPHLRPRVGNPDELRSNRMNRTLDTFKHRVTAPEEGVSESIAESVQGAVVTALNEEAVVCAALGNKAGINIVVTYEAFAVKMLGALRQEIIFARHQKEHGVQPTWLSVPIVLSSHTWENGKNEQSHQDPTMAEALWSEMSDVSRVLFPVDANSAMACLSAVYQTRGQIWTMVVPKLELPNVLSQTQAQQLIEDGALILRSDEQSKVILVAVGAYQLQEILRASEILGDRKIQHTVVVVMEPGKFRAPRDLWETSFVASAALRQRLFPDQVQARVWLSHTRPESLAGVIRPLDTGSVSTRLLGYRNRGGTLDLQGMLLANGCTAADVVKAVESL